MGGIPVFVGTRVPIRTLLDYLEAGDSVDIFLDHFPSVSSEQAIAALELAKEMLTTYANPAWWMRPEAFETWIAGGEVVEVIEIRLWWNFIAN